MQAFKTVTAFVLPWRILNSRLSRGSATLAPTEQSDVFNTPEINFKFGLSQAQRKRIGKANVNVKSPNL